MTDKIYIIYLQYCVYLASVVTIISSIILLLPNRRSSRDMILKWRTRLENTRSKPIHFAQYVIIVSACLSLFFNILLNVAKDRQSASQKRVSDLLIQEARKDAATAISDAAKANMRNTALRIDLRSATTELTVEQRKLAGAQMKQAKAEEERAVAQLALEKTLDAVRKRQMPRTLTSKQRSRLIQLLSTTVPGVVSVNYMAGDGESQAFAIELNGLLKAAGWTITSNPEQILTVPSPQGAFIVVDNAKAAPRYAAILQQAFQDIGYTLPGLQDPKIAQGKVVLLVGHRKQ